MVGDIPNYASRFTPSLRLSVRRMQLWVPSRTQGDCRSSLSIQPFTASPEEGGPLINILTLALGSKSFDSLVNQSQISEQLITPTTRKHKSSRRVEPSTETTYQVAKDCGKSWGIGHCSHRALNWIAGGRQNGSKGEVRGEVKPKLISLVFSSFCKTSPGF